jgi:preprotein translocase subunit SecE
MLQVRILPDLILFIRRGCLVMPNVVSSFFRESYAELKKVIWPSWDRVVDSTRVVLVSTVLFSAFFGIVDFVLTKGLITLF